MTEPDGRDVVRNWLHAVAAVLPTMTDQEVWRLAESLRPAVHVVKAGLEAAVEARFQRIMTAEFMEGEQ